MKIINFIISILAILSIITISLILIKKSLRKKLDIQEKNRNFFYIKKLNKLNKLESNPEEFLDAVNNFARDFFKEAFDLSYNFEYSELINEFKKTGKNECITFCTLISEFNYSGEKIEKNKLSVLIKLLEKIIQKNKILAQEEKEELKKKGKQSKVLQSFVLRK